jgi:hypothetical protein
MEGRLPIRSGATLMTNGLGEPGCIDVAWYEEAFHGP